MKKTISVRSESGCDVIDLHPRAAYRRSMNYGQPRLYKCIEFPEELLKTVSIDGACYTFAGDVRLGDLTGDGKPDLLFYRSADGGFKPCFFAAMSLDGDVLWAVGEDGDQPVRPGSVALYDIDGDGADEIICFFKRPGTTGTADSLENVVLQVRDGKTGNVLRESAPEALTSRRGEGPNWVHQRILIANFRGTERPRDFCVKLGSRLLAFDEDLNLLWAYTIRWNEYGKCSAYIPSVGDIDADGKDEVNGGYFLIDDDGTVLWEKQIAPNMDSVAITAWDDGNPRCICSGGGCVIDTNGDAVLELGEDTVPHGQEVRTACFSREYPAPQMVIRYLGHTTDAMLVDNEGEIRNTFQLNESPNHTGMEIVYWNGSDQPALLYNGGMLWRGTGECFATLPDLPDPVGPDKAEYPGGKMGWYHCIPANVCGDDREGIVLYNPWDSKVWIYTPSPVNESAFSRYVSTPRQYNARLMD